MNICLDKKKSGDIYFPGQADTNVEKIIALMFNELITNLMFKGNIS